MARYTQVATVSWRGGTTGETPEEKIAANRAGQLRLVERACLDRPDFVCMTEVITWYGLGQEHLPLIAEPLDGPTIRTFAEVAQRHACYIIVPIYTQEDGRIFNAQVLLDRHGEIAAVYHKIHPTIGEIEMGVTPGTEPVVAETDKGRVGFAICFDLNFRDVAEGNAAGGAELVFFSSMYPGGLQLRIWAHDFGVFVASATPGDRARIVDPLGRVLTESDATYSPILSKRLNLDYAVMHLSENCDQFEAIKQKYGAGIELDVTRPEAIFCMYSHLPDVTCEDVIREFELEVRTLYYRRANHIRAAALPRRK